MKWINPRKKLPEIDQLIWCLFIENKEGERAGLPAAHILLAQAKKDRYGVIYVEIINYKGYSTSSKHFFDWWHWDQSEKETGGEETIHKTFSSREEDNIVAWFPYQGLPKWDYINREESIAIISKTDEYKKGIEFDQTKKIIEKAYGSQSPYFIYLKDTKPVEKGCYVIANKNGVWLSNYDPSKNEKWLAPNGEPVIVWYPIPNSY